MRNGNTNGIVEDLLGGQGDIPPSDEPSVHGAGWLLFDREYYLTRRPDVAEVGLDPYTHYIEYGWAEGELPHPLFDAEYYLTQRSDVRAAKINPLLYYLKQGATERGDPHPLFMTSYYLDQVPAPLDDAPLIHYLGQGWRLGLRPHPLFDVGYYLSQRADVHAARVNPLRYYLEHGATEHGDPHPLFFTEFYLSQIPTLPDVAPLSHYLAEGWKLGLQPHPLFDPTYYLSQRPDVLAAGIEPLTHYVGHGWREGTRPHPLFDVDYYLAQLPPETEVLSNQLIHYLQHGWREGARPHPLFDPEYYLTQVPAERAPDFNPLTDYLIRGWREDWQPHPLFDPKYYLTQLPGDSAPRLNPLTHYVEHGWRRDIQPHPLFDSEYYLAQLPQVRAAGLNPLIHYIEYGWKAEGDPHLLFYTAFYLGKASPTARLAPLIHYLTEGQHSGLSPHPLFDPEYFLRRTPRSEVERKSPLAQYVSSSWDEAVDPHPLFEASFYLSQQPKRDHFRTPLEHYLKIGWRDGISPHPLFDTVFYLATNPDLQETGLHPLVHFVMHGREEGRRGSPHDVPRMVRRFMDQGKLDRAAALHAAFAPIPVGTIRQTICLPITGLHDYAKSHRLLVREFPAETIEVSKPVILGDKRTDLQSGALDCLPAFVCCLDEAVIVAGTRVAICSDGVLLHEEIERNQSDPDLSIKARSVISRAKDGWALATLNRRPNDRIPEGVLLSCDHDPNYFHWLVEVLPKLAMVDEVETLRHVPLLIRDDLHTNLLRALELANVHGRRIIQLRAGCTYRVERLVYPSDICRTVDRYSGPTAFKSDCILAPRWIRTVVDRITRALNLQGTFGNRGLFVTRHTGLRKISNIQDLEYWFAARNFDVETFQDVSFDYQVLRSRQVDTMIGATGAAIANMMFCRPGSEVVVLMSSHRGQNPYVWQQLATVFGHNLKLVVGERLFVRSDYEIHDDYRIDLDILKAALPTCRADQRGVSPELRPVIPKAQRKKAEVIRRQIKARR